jgi:uncharacterized cupin superfamily protein
MQQKPIRAEDVQVQTGQTNYPEPFARVVAGRTKRKLGDIFGLENFGVNLTTLAPGSASALFHTHAVQDEFIFVLTGHPTLAFGDDEYRLSPGDCIGFRAGTGIGHQLVNRTDEAVSYLEAGDRTPGEQVEYPRDDIRASLGPDGSWIMTHKDGTPFANTDPV